MPSKELHDTFDDIVRELRVDALTRVRSKSLHVEDDAFTLEGFEMIGRRTDSDGRRARV